MDKISLYTVLACADGALALGLIAPAWLCRRGTLDAQNTRLAMNAARAATLLWTIAPFTWGGQLFCHLLEAGRYSLSGIAPTCSIAALILALCQRLSLRGDISAERHGNDNAQGRGNIRPLCSALWLLLLALASLVPETSRHASFMMTYSFAILFFLSRPLSLGCTLYALSGIAATLRLGSTDRRLSQTSKDATFAASIFFLGGEIVGCYWGFMGWGTTWRWSGNFLFSAMLFVLFMVALHVPVRWFAGIRSHNIALGLPLLCVALCLVLTKIL